MKRVEKTPGRALGSLCRAVLVLSLVLPGAFAWGEPAQDVRDEPLQESILSRAWLSDIRIRQGKDIFVPNLPLWRFLVSYNSTDSREQNIAYAFLLGVADATERKVWCSRDDYTSTTIFEAINEGLKKLKSSRYNEHGAYVITEVLKKTYPCKKGEALPDSFVQGDSVRVIKYDPLKKSILIGEGLTNEWIIKQGEDIFVTNLSLRRFLGSYKNKGSEEQTAAYAFLLGISDATEGKAWCSYNSFKSTTVLETIYIGLKRLDSSRYDERAAYIVTEILKNDFPCKKER